MNWRRVLFWTCGLLILLIAGLVVSVQTINWSEARPRVESLVKELTGRELKIEGDLQFRFLPTPTLTAGKISFANASWGSRDTMLEADSMSFTLRLVPLLTTRLRVRSISLRDANLLLETGNNGQRNWEFGSASGDQAADNSVFGSLSDLQIDKMVLDWKPLGRDASKFNIDSVRLSSRQLGGGFDLDAVYKEEGEDFHFAASLSSLKSYLTGGGLRGTVTSESQGASFKLDGEFGNLRSIDGVRLKVTGKGTRWPLILRIAGLASQKIPKWSIVTTLSEHKGDARFEDLDLTIGSSDFSGHLVVDTKGARPKVSGQLSSKKVSMEIIEQFEVTDGTDSASQENAETVFSHKPWNLKWMDTFDASLDLKIDRLELPIFVYDDASAKFVLENGRLSVDPIAATLAGADARMSMVLDSSTTQPGYTVRVSARHADVGEIVGHWAKPPFMTGKADFDLNAQGTGDSFGAMMTTLTGQIRLLVGEGTARAGIAEQAVKTVVVGTMHRVLGGKHLDTVKMNCFASDFEITSGVANATVFLLDTEHATVKGTGSIDFGREQWNLDLTPHPKKTTLTVAIPVDVRGSFRNPEFAVEKVGILKKLAGTVGAFFYPPAALGGLAELGTGDNECLKIAQLHPQKEK
jgi:uncharacterized protein involved in outer membrane biogenesis